MNRQLIDDTTIQINAVLSKHIINLNCYTRAIRN